MLFNLYVSFLKRWQASRFSKWKAKFLLVFKSYVLFHVFFQRRYSGSSFSPSGSDGFDCGASSGYGSPGWGNTPLSSPAPQTLLPLNVQKALNDHGFFDENENNNVSLGPTIIDETYAQKPKVKNFLFEFSRDVVLMMYVFSTDIGKI